MTILPWGTIYIFWFYSLMSQVDFSSMTLNTFLAESRAWVAAGIDEAANPAPMADVKRMYYA